MKKRQGVYAILNFKEDIKYIGSSCNIIKRTSEHKGKLRAGIHYNKRLQADWNRLGEDSFTFVILEDLLENLQERERYWINKLRTERDNIYNLSIPADNNGTLSHAPETIELLSRVAKEWQASNIEQVKEQKLKSVEALKSWRQENPKYVKEIEERFIEAGKLHGLKIAKPVIAYNDTVCHMFKSAREAADILNLNYNRVHEALKGKRVVSKGVYKDVKSHKGFIFCYKEDLLKADLDDGAFSKYL